MATFQPLLWSSLVAFLSHNVGLDLFATDMQVFLPGCKRQLLLWNTRYSPSWTCCLPWAHPSCSPAQDSAEAGAEERVPAAVTLPCPAESMAEPVALGYVPSARPFCSCRYIASWSYEREGSLSWSSSPLCKGHHSMPKREEGGLLLFSIITCSSFYRITFKGASWSLQASSMAI